MYHTTLLDRTRMRHYIILGGSGPDSVPNQLQCELTRRGHVATLLTKQECDVTDPDQINTRIQSAAESYSRIDGLIYSSCYVQRAPMLDIQAASVEEWHKSFSINVIGAHLAVQAAQPWLAESNGCVLLYGSRAGEDYDYGTSITFAVSKGALHSLTRVLSHALAPKIRVNGVIMGFLPTDRIKKSVPGHIVQQRLDQWIVDSALDHPVTMKDVLDASMLLIENSSMTGQILRVDSGRGVGRHG